jgi:CRP-like cAMP-binding protein
MIAPVHSPIACENRILASASVAADLFSSAREIKITTGQTLYDGHLPTSHCIFPESALMSLMSYTENGASVAVGMVGNEGLIGVAGLFDERLLPYRTIAQTSGTALKVPAAKVKESLRQDLALRNCIVHFLHAMFTQAVQTAACNRFHVTEQRLARWLLLARDRLKLDKMPFTHESLAAVIGTDRVSITRAAQRLKKQGILSYSRGKTAVVDAEGLLSVSCECYLTIKKQYDALAEMCDPKRI